MTRPSIARYAGWTAAALVSIALSSGSALAQDKYKDGKKEKAKPTAAQLKEQAAKRTKQGEKIFSTQDKSRDGTLRDKEVPKGWLDRFDLDGDDKITKKEFMEIWQRPAWGGRATRMRHPRARARDSLVRFDRNKDGVVVKDEYPGGSNVFKQADRNNDKKLDWKELLKLAKEELADIRKKMKSPGRYEFLQIFDINGDNRITSAEYDGPKRVFAKYDDNRDGQVSYAELYPERARNMMRAAAQKPAPDSMNVIKSMDKNEDGRVSREEWKGTEAAWKRLDKNSDGWISTADSR